MNVTILYRNISSNRLHKNTMYVIYKSLIISTFGDLINFRCVQMKISIFSVIDLFGIRQETIDWDKTAKSDFEGSINVEMHSDSLDSRLSKNTLVRKHK